MKKIIILVSILLLFTSTVNAEKTKILPKSGIVDDISLRDGKVFYGDSIIIDGFKTVDYKNNKEYIDPVSLIAVKRLTNDNYYLSACSSNFCYHYLLDKNKKLTYVELGSKYYPVENISESPDGRYISTITELEGGEGDFIVSVYDTVDKKMLGKKYIRDDAVSNIDFKNGSVQLDISNGNVLNIETNHFTKTSLQEDYEKFKQEDLRKERITKITNFIKKYYLYVIGLIALTLGIKFLRKPKTTK